MRAESKSEPDRALNRTAQQQKPITGTKKSSGGPKPVGVIVRPSDWVSICYLKRPAHTP